MTDEEFLTIQEYAMLVKIRGYDPGWMRGMGHQATNLCKEMGLSPTRRKTRRGSLVNAYPRRVLESLHWPVEGTVLQWPNRGEDWTAWYKTRLGGGPDDNPKPPQPVSAAQHYPTPSSGAYWDYKVGWIDPDEERPGFNGDF